MVNNFLNCISEHDRQIILENEQYISACWDFYKLKYLHHFLFQSFYPTFNIHGILIPWTKNYSMFYS